MTFKKVNQETPEVKEYDELVRKLINLNQKEVFKKINKIPFTYSPMSEDQVKEMVAEKNKI